MRLADYLRGQRFVLVSRLTPDEAQQRINDEAGSAYLPFVRGVVGWARFGRLRLRHMPSWYRNDFRPVMAGTISANGAGSRLDLNFRAPIHVYLMPVGWLIAAAIAITFSLAFAGIKDGPAWLPVVPVLVVMTFVVLVPGLQISMTLANADESLSKILDFLREAADAREA